MRLFWKKKELEKKENPVGSVLFSTPYYISPFQGEQTIPYVNEGYRGNPTVRRCVDLIAKSAANIGIELCKYSKNGTREEVYNHPALELLYKPNKLQNKTQFLMQLFVDELTTGNAFVIAGGLDKKPVDLWRLDPTRMSIKPANTGLPESYRFTGANGEQRSFPSNPITAESQVFHYFQPSQNNPLFGETVMRSCATWVDISNDGAKWNAGLLQNGAQPSGALRMETAPSVEQMTKLREVLESRQSSPRNAGKPMILSKGTEWIEMGKSPKDMDFNATLNYADRKIADAYGVPFPLISPDAATFANMDTARESLYEDVIIPYFNSFLERFGSWLLSKFPGSEGLCFEADYDDIPAFEDKRARKQERLIKAIEGRLITTNEAREAMQEEPVEGGDIILVPSGLIPMSVAVDETLSSDNATIDAALNAPST
jgi:HK97 family phage portal protein